MTLAEQVKAMHGEADRLEARPERWAAGKAKLFRAVAESLTRLAALEGEALPPKAGALPLGEPAPKIDFDDECPPF